jgi:hypothetical protein
VDPFLFSAIILALTGCFIGFASGFFGVGGGFLMVPVQFWLLTSLGVDPTLAIRVAFGTSLAVVLPTAFSSAYGHYCRQCVLVKPLILMLVPGIIGGFIGAAISSHAPGRILELLFGAVLILAAVRMYFSHASCKDNRVPDSLLVYAPWGFVFGLVSGMLGIGGGIVMVPVMTTILGYPIRQAIGTSTAFMLCSSVGGVISYIINGLSVPGLPPFSLGYVDIAFWAVLAVVSVPVAQLGVRAAHRIPPDRIRILFILLMVVMGVHMIAGLYVNSS